MTTLSLEKIAFNGHTLAQHIRRQIDETELGLRLWERSKGHPCWLCGREIREWPSARVDHVRGDSDDPDNLRLAHRKCSLTNRVKP